MTTGSKPVETVAHALCVPRRYSADAWAFANANVEKVSTRHVENVRYMNSQAPYFEPSRNTTPAEYRTPFKASFANPEPGENSVST